MFFSPYFPDFLHLKIRVQPPSADELKLTEEVADHSHLRTLMDVVTSELFFPRFKNPINEGLYKKYCVIKSLWIVCVSMVMQPRECFSMTFCYFI